MDSKKIVQKLTLSTDKRLTLCLRQEPGKSLRPPELLKSIFYLTDTDVKQARIMKQ